MKARVKATGDIVEVAVYGNAYDNYNDKLITYYKDKNGRCYADHQLDFDNTDSPIALDYWEKLKHQYAGMAMQGLVANQSIVHGQDFDEALDEHITVNAVAIAHALVEKLKEGKV